MKVGMCCSQVLADNWSCRSSVRSLSGYRLEENHDDFSYVCLLHVGGTVSELLN